MTEDDELRALALAWLDAAHRVGWGVEGPADHARVTAAVLALRDGASPDIDIEVSRTPGLVPADALREAADLLVEAARARANDRGELLSAARGWLAIAAG